MKIDWNQPTNGSARVMVTDGVATNYVSGDQLGDWFCMREVAEAYAKSYDHNGSDDVVVARIVDLKDGETCHFAFDPAGNLFEWETDREFTSC